MKHLLSTTTAILLGTLSGEAAAQNTVDVGVIHDKDVTIVQKLLYPKATRQEYGAFLAVMPFDAYTFTPAVALTVAHHFREDMGIEGVLMGGYGMKSATYRELESPPYGVAPDAYGFLGSTMLDFQWSPIYAKMNVAGQRIYHHDVFFTLGLGATMEAAIQPDSTKTISPTIGTGVGFRVFTGKHYAMRLQLRDDLLIQKRTKTADIQGTFLKQNVSILIGISKLSGK
jgi:outer membrane beta-barrel protein